MGNPFTRQCVDITALRSASWSVATPPRDTGRQGFSKNCRESIGPTQKAAGEKRRLNVELGG